MTKINRLVLKGFKSFANHTELVFGDNFNVVLGPNGSGKSNILDALTFVLGRSSSKAMRAEKSGNLVYNGGKSKRGAKEAEVSIFFDNATKLFPVEDPEVKITRIVRPNGQSKYKINNQTRTRQQILDMMALAKVDPEGHNIILQGDIVKFVDMSSVDKRMIVEEIAGIGVYEEKKNKALKELEKVETKLGEADIVLSERATYLKELKKDRDEALEFKSLKGTLEKYKASYLSKQIAQKEKVKEEQEARLKKHNDNITELREKIEETKSGIDERDSGIKEINNEIEEKGEVEQVKLNKEMERLRIEVATNKTKIESDKNEIEKVKERKKQLDESIAEVDEKISRLEAEKEGLVKDKTDSESSLNQIENSIEQFKKKHKISEDTENIEKDIEDIDKQSEDLQKKIHELREKQQELLREKDKTEFMIGSFDEKIDEVAAIEKENKQQIGELKDKRLRFKTVASELSTALNEDSSLASQIANSRIKLAKSNDELAKLKARNISIREKVQGGTAINEIIDMGKKDKGIFGTVSDLGQVNKKYALALEVAAGGRIRSLVVEDDLIAKKCIEHLKKNRLGIATFLPLNKVRTRLIDADVYDLRKKQGVHGFAIDLVKFDDKFKNIFSHVFSNTLVVDNLETARKIGIGTTRMVTLEGDLVEMSGAMIGGYRQRSKGIGFKEEEVLKDMQEYEEVVENLTNVVQTLEKRRVENDETLTKLRQEKSELEGSILSLENKLNIKQGEDVLDFKKTKTDLTNKIKEIDTEVDKVQDDISDTNKELTQGKIKKQELRNKINELRNPTVIAELNAFEDKRSELKEKIIHLTADVKNFDVQINNMLKSEKESIVKILKQHTKEIESFEEEINKLTEENTTKTEDLIAKEKFAKEFYSKFKALFTKRQKLEEEIRKFEDKKAGFDFRIREIEQKVNNVNIDKAKVSAELAGLAKEFEPYAKIDFSDVKKTEEELRKDINKLEYKLENSSNVNLRALEIYDKVEEEYNKLLEKKDKLAEEKENVLVLMNEIETKKKDIFMKTFDEINGKFQDIFSSLSKKGQAFLELENPETVFDGGVSFKVKLSTNKFMDIKSLSGGEKTITALAFIFAVQEYEPASFYILDEVDAALDKSNAEKLAGLVKQYCDKAQYIIISHNDAVISSADILYGISMNEHGISKITSLKV